jgi:hypothetical protein
VHWVRFPIARQGRNASTTNEIEIELMFVFKILLNLAIYELIAYVQSFHLAEERLKPSSYGLLIVVIFHAELSFPNLTLLASNYGRGKRSI